MDIRTIRSVRVVKDLYGVLEWVEKRNKMKEEYLGVYWGALPRFERVSTECSLVENYQAIYDVDISPFNPKIKGYLVHLE